MFAAVSRDGSFRIMTSKVTDKIQNMGAVANGTVAAVLNSSGPTGANTAIQGWLRVNINGTDRYIPYW
ncbi:MAG TPA: hypothetical protein PLS53_00060 [Thermoanaerobaculaceae bacterium]|nr:hypothetical protein [Thermoanaerobaculaceae bacterium]